jgi:hypothetical protein
VIRFGVRDRLQKIPYSLLLAALGYAAPVMGLFKTGQINTAIWLLMIGGCFSLAYRKQYVAGTMLAVATAVKVFPVIFFPYLLVKKQWEAAGAFMVTTALLWLSTIPFFGVGGVYRFWQYPFSLLMQGKLNFIHESISLYGTFRNVIRDGMFQWTEIPKKILISNVEHALTVLTVAALCGVGYLLWKHRTELQSRATIYEYTLIICVFLLFSKSIHPQYLFWLLPVLLLWISNFKKRWLVAIGIALILFTQFYNHFFLLHQVLLFRMHTIGVIGIAVAAVMIYHKSIDTKKEQE